MAERENTKEKDIGQIVRYLTATFNQATSKIERAARVGKPPVANRAYLLQREFAYLLNEVQQGPRCMLQKNIAECNEFLDRTIQDLASERS